MHVAIVPFNKNVNVGSSNYNQTWINWEEWNGINGSCSHWKYDTKAECESNKRTWTPKNHTDWNGCLADRNQDYDVQNTAPTPSDAETLFPAVEASP